MPPAAHPSLQRVREAAAAKGVSLDIVTFPESTHTAEEAAQAIGAELGQIVKSLVFVSGDPQGPGALIALVCGTDRVDIGRLGAAIGHDDLRRASAQEAARASGFVIGGIPPFGHREPLPVVMDPGLLRHPRVWAAAGTPNAVFPVDPRTLVSLCDAVVAPCVAAAEPATRRGNPS